ncbi:hypothetical protein FHP25_27160 [Vineibacter terrae]|uniref:Uncharacterized protein n=1 Tax=Vineibacter terrae TaxID=2586908 RepID=A0A5C8PEC8_9HYPH|nr:hypothetical protein [Vineibacter terrae]TXL72107.1 hypothetical protein FHP25_27160 [Vineibacter terrae]
MMEVPAPVPALARPAAPRQPKATALPAAMMALFQAPATPVVRAAWPQQQAAMTVLAARSRRRVAMPVPAAAWSRLLVVISTVPGAASRPALALPGVATPEARPGSPPVAEKNRHAGPASGDWPVAAQPLPALAE